MTCTAHMGSDCNDQPERRVYLGSLSGQHDLCAPCLAYATRLGMDPREERRAVQRIPEWRRRSLAKVMDHGRHVA